MICYTDWMEESKRWIVHKTLTQVEKYGISSPNHFYITFQTSYPNVKIPENLLFEHPKEMQILIKDEFWSLKVNDDSFSIQLLFHEKNHTLEIPFKSLINFIDPGAEFGLELTPPPPSKEISMGENVISFDRFRKIKKT